MPTFLTEIAEQPDALRATLHALQPRLPDLASWFHQRRATSQRVVFAGMGASYNAAIPAASYLVQHGLIAQVCESSDLLYEDRNLINAQTLLVATSQSGNSVEIQKLVELARGVCPVVGVTNNPDGTLARLSDMALITDAGIEVSIALKTYTTSMAALYLLAVALTDGPTDATVSTLLNTANTIEQRLPLWREQVTNWQASLEGVQFFEFLARGPSRASAQASALLMKESAKLHTEAMSAALFRHGPIEILNPDVAVILFTGLGPTAPLNRRLSGDLRQLGTNLTVIGPDDRPDTINVDIGIDDPFALPIAEIVPVQLLAAHLSASRGIDTDRFRFIVKVATRE